MNEFSDYQAEVYQKIDAFDPADLVSEGDFQRGLAVNDDPTKEGVKFFLSSAVLFSGERASLGRTFLLRTVATARLQLFRLPEGDSTTHKKLFRHLLNYCLKEFSYNEFNFQSYLENGQDYIELDVLKNIDITIRE